jgi:hypothetical protein
VDSNRLRGSREASLDLLGRSWHIRAVVDDARSEVEVRRKPRLGLVIRLAIYVPLLGFFGWRAWERFANEREAADEVFREQVGSWLVNPPQTIMLPNGEALPMLTPEQAAAQGYPLPSSVLEELEQGEQGGQGEEGEPVHEGPGSAAAPAPDPSDTAGPEPIAGTDDTAQ